MLINNAVITGSFIVNGVSVTGITGSSELSSSYLALSSSYLVTSASYAVTSASYAQSSASLSIRTGNLEATSSTLVSASSSFAAQSASLSTRLTTDESNFTSLSSSFVTTSGSISSRVTTIEGQYATTGSNNFTGPQFVNQASNAISFTSTASLYTDGGLRVAKDSFVSGTAYFNNITVYGTSSIEYITSSQVNIGSNVITVNTDTPAIRFGGLSVFDSGSTQLTGSLFWDSEKNHWIYSNPSGSAYNSAMLMNGPRNTGSLGTEQGTTNNALMKGQGGDHITSSQMIDDGTTVQIPGNLQVTGSLSGSSAVFSSTVNATNGLLIGNGGATATTNYLPKFTGTSTIGNSAITDNGSLISVGLNTLFSGYIDGLGLRATSSSAFGGTGVGVEIGYSGGLGYVQAYNRSTSAYQPIKVDGSTVSLNISGVQKLFLDASGNLGLGVTPSAWGASSFAFQTQGGAVWSFSSAYMDIWQNSYYNGTSSIYQTTAAASFYRQSAGSHEWNIAPSGTAGATISWTQAMTLNASGNLLIGTTTDAGTGKLQVNGNAAINGTVIGTDQTFGGAYRTFAFGGNANGFNRIFAANDASDGMYLNAATGRGIYFRVNGGGSNVVSIESTGAATFSSTLQVGGNASSTITIGDAVASGTDANLRLRTGSTKYSWLIASQNNIAGFEITPSTTVGGTTYSTPALSILPTGAATFSSTITASTSISVANNGAQNALLSATSTFADGYDAILQLNNTHTGGQNWNIRSTNNSQGNFGGGKLVFSNQSIGAANATMVLTSTGNVGIGTSSPSNGLGTAMQIGGTTNFMNFVGNSYFLNNWYYDSSGNAKYITSSFASGIIQNGFGEIKFFTNGSGTADATFTPSEKLIITNAGNVGIGTSSPFSNYRATFANTSVGTDRSTIYLQGIYSGTNPTAGIDFGSTNGVAVAAIRQVMINTGNGASDISFHTWDGSSLLERMRITSDGILKSLPTYNNTTATAANVQIDSNGYLARSTASSRRFKENITDWNSNGLNTILSLKPKTFTYKADYYKNSNISFLGLIAEEVAEVSPYLADYENEDRTGQVENVRYANIVVPLIKAIQEQQCTINTLKTCLGIA